MESSSTQQTSSATPASSADADQEVCCEAYRGTRCVSTTRNHRIDTLMEMVKKLSTIDDPKEVLGVFSYGMVKLDGPRGYVSLSTRDLEPGQYRITRLIDIGDVDALKASDPWANREDLPVHTGGFFGELIRDPHPEIYHDLRIENDPVVGDALGKYRSMIALPIFDHGEPLNWAVFFRREPDAYSSHELEDAILRANLVGGTVRRTLMMQELQRAKAYIDREIEQISRIQHTLLPDEMPTIHGAQIAAHYETHGEAGGDYYDFLPLRFDEQTGKPDPNGPLGIIIADASGHGPAAAVVMAMLHAILHAYPALPDDPGEVLRHLNGHLNAKRIEGSFVTAFFAVYDPQARELRYARAGHNPPLVKTPNSTEPVARLDGIGGIPLGVMPDVEYETSSMTLEPGQTLVLYTDGVTEASCPSGGMFGIEGMEQALRDCSGEPDCVVRSIHGALTAHEDCIEPNDDQTLVALRVDA